jgi:transcriptional regulator with XRE-family HTH domain
MSADFTNFSERLRQARIAKSLSQRELSQLAGVPQSHISKIESNQVDLRLSSLVALAHALDLELALVPRQVMPAVHAISTQAIGHASPPLAGVAQQMSRLQDRLRALQVSLPALPELDAARKAFGALKALSLDESAIEQIRRISQALGRAAAKPETIAEATRQMTELNSRLAQLKPARAALSEPRPAYSLDEGND